MFRVCHWGGSGGAELGSQEYSTGSVSTGSGRAELGSQSTGSISTGNVAIGRDGAELRSQAVHKKGVVGLS